MVASLVWIVPAAALSAVLFAAYLAWDTLRQNTGTERMQEVAGMIYEGAVAFLPHQ